MPPFQKWAVRGMKAGEAGTAASLIAAAFAQEAAGLGLGEVRREEVGADQVGVVGPTFFLVSPPPSTEPVGGPSGGRAGRHTPEPHRGCRAGLIHLIG